MKEVPGNSLFSSSHWKNVSRSISLRYTLCCCPVVQLSWVVPFITFEWLVYELPAANQRVSSSVSPRSPIIISLFSPDPRKSMSTLCKAQNRGLRYSFKNVLGHPHLERLNQFFILKRYSIKEFK